jgi:valyl-tRNA synthetase
MDTWATSSETPQINARWGDGGTAPRAPLPMSLRPQAHEIIRTWAFYTLVKSWVHHRAVPWTDAMISGWMLAADRENISKSTGNAPTDPRTLLDKHGADAVRYWALSAAGHGLPVQRGRHGLGAAAVREALEREQADPEPPRGLRPDAAPRARARCGPAVRARPPR